MSDRYTIEITLDGKDNVSQHLSKVNNELDELQNQGNRGTNAANALSGGLSGMITAASGAAAALGLMEIGGKVMELNELGAEVRATNKVFTELAGGPEAAANGLNVLRSATSGVVDDMTLMAGANSLLLTGLAKTTEEAAGLTEVAVKLGGAMGQGPADAIQNLNAALLNNSFERLDMLGISAARVRERVNELKAAGMDMSEAFAQATMEQGQLAIERLGSAANANVTAMNILSNRFENAQQAAANLTNQVIETGAQLLILADIAMGGTGGIPQLEQQRADAEAAEAAFQNLVDTAERYVELSDSAYFRQTGQQMELTPFLDTADVARQFQTLSEEMQAQVGSGNFFQTMFGENATAEMKAIGRQMAAGLGDGFETAPDAFLEQYAADFDRRYMAVAEASQHLEYQTVQTNEALAEQARIMEYAASSDSFLIASTQAVDYMRDLRSEYGAFQEMVSDNSFVRNGNMFFDPDAVQEVRSQAESLADEYERVKAIAESSDYELVSETEVERAREIAANANTMANEAERMAEAIENMSLAELAGTNHVDSRLNEFYQGALAQIEDPELRAQAEAQFNLNSGVETAESRIIEYGEALTAAITEQFGVSAGQRAGEDFVNAFVEGTRQGLTGEALQDYVEQQVGFALGEGSVGGGQQITVQQGEGYIALAERTGIDRATLEEATGGARMLMAGEVITLPDGTNLIALGEGSATQSVNEAAGNVFGSIMGNMSDNGMLGNGIQSDYSYYTPETGGMDYSNNPEPIVTPEEAESVSMMADDMLAVETSLQTISTIDTSATFTPMAEGISAANDELTRFEADIRTVTGQEYRMRMGLVPYLDFANIPELANNSAFVELFATILRNNPQLTEDSGS